MSNGVLKEYAKLHAEVPETQPKHEKRGPLAIYDDTYGNWRPCWERDFADERYPYNDEAIALCRCAALSFVAKAPNAIRMAKEPTPAEEAYFFRCSKVITDTMVWMDNGADSDLELIRICREIRTLQNERAVPHAG